MNTEPRAPLTLLEACTLLARETVSLLNGRNDLELASELRDALEILDSMQDLGDDGALLAWVDGELEGFQRFSETDGSYQNLVKLDTPLPMPDPAMQLDAVCALLKAMARGPCTLDDWEDMKEAARLLTVVDGLDDAVLRSSASTTELLTTEALHKQLTDVQTALQLREQNIVPAGMEQM